MAIVDDGDSTTHGYGTGSPTTSEARLCAQFCYDAYGSLLSIQGLHPFPDPRTGHKGLHLDRLDAGVADPLTGAPIARHEVGATHAYFVRNRHYSPALGRFLQRDPNATATLIVAHGASLGRGVRSLPSPMFLPSHLVDGVNVQQYLRASPWIGSDALGTEFTYSSMLAAMGVQGVLGGLISGSVTSALGGDFWQGARAGFIGGLMGGAAGSIANGFITGAAWGAGATLGGHAAVGAVDGAVSGFFQAVASGASWRDALSDAFVGGIIGGLTGGMGDALIAARSGRRAVDQALNGLKRGKQGHVRLVRDEGELQALFLRMSRGGRDVTPQTYRGQMVVLGDGTTVGLRYGSTSGGPAIDITWPSSGSVKVHVENW